MPVILGANSASGGYNITNSLRFNSGSSDYLNRTPASSGNRDTFTVSFLVKRANITSGQRIFTAGTSIGTNNNNVSSMLFESTDTFIFFGEIGGVASFNLTTTQLFRDVSAWYHIVVAVDTTQATSSNRIKIYSNGSQITSFSTSTYMTQNTDTFFNANNLHVISGITNAGFLNGYLSEFYLIDGSQLTPSSFGETDEDTGIWKPKAFSGSYGTNGFYLQFKNSASLGTDSSGNGNNFTVNNLTSVDQTTDTPTNNFATLNPLDNYYANSTFTEGNLKTVQGGSTYAWNLSTIGVSSGKWYAEVKLTTSGSFAVIGVTDRSPTQSLNDILGSGAYDYSVHQYNGDVYNNAGTNPANTDQSYASSYASGDIIGIALDLDNNKIYWSKNGLWSDGSGNWDESSPTGFISITAPASTNNGQYFFASGDYQSGSSPTFEWNFGSPIYSANSYQDANGFGNFSYSVPSGYYSLCTKNLYQYGF